jgi:hypothetical protein
LDGGVIFRLPNRRAIGLILPRRKAILGLSLRLSPWFGAPLLAELIRLARKPKTGWSIGVYGAGAEFATRCDAVLEIEVGEETLILRTPGGALRLRPPAGTRMFELVGPSGWVERLVLALHRSRLSGMPAIGVTELGADDVTAFTRIDTMLDGQYQDPASFPAAGPRRVCRRQTRTRSCRQVVIDGAQNRWSIRLRRNARHLARRLPRRDVPVASDEASPEELFRELFETHWRTITFGSCRASSLHRHRRDADSRCVARG